MNKDGHGHPTVLLVFDKLHAFQFFSGLATLGRTLDCIPHKLALPGDTSVKLRIPNPRTTYTNMTPTITSPQNDQTSRKSRHTETCVRIIFFTPLENEEQLGSFKINLWLWHPNPASQKTLFTPRDVKCKLSEYCSDLFELSSNGIPTDYFHPGHAMFYSLFDCSPSDIGGCLGSSPLHDGVGPAPPPANAWSTPPPVIAAGAKFPPFDLKVQCHKEKNGRRMGWLIACMACSNKEFLSLTFINNIPHPCSWMFMVFKPRTCPTSWSSKWQINSTPNIKKSQHMFWLCQGEEWNLSFCANKQLQISSNTSRTSTVCTKAPSLLQPPLLPLC